MGTATRWQALAGLALCLTCCPRLWAADFELTAAETRRVTAREIVIRANLDSGQRRGTVRAAALIDASPQIVFQMMTRCADALKYVPHLRVCRVRDRGHDGSWELIEHEIDFGWYAPRVKYVFRADFVADRSITFHQVSGDFKANEGVWEFEPFAAGDRTLLRYRAYIDPPGYVPNWLARSTFKRELPQMLTELRRRCEAEQRVRAQASASPH
jgi:ribosome-associated toxin RatA of RatAB toxin-antitoxin module